MKSIITITFLVSFLILSGFKVQNTKWFTKNGHVDFFSHTPAEDIKAKNDNVISVLEAETGKIEFKLPVNSFVFERQLMQEHFNENYMESTKYPDSKFSGQISNPGAINYEKDGVYPISAKGKLTMHGVTNELDLTGTLTVKGKSVTIESKFSIVPEDYKITIPAAVKDVNKSHSSLDHPTS